MKIELAFAVGDKVKITPLSVDSYVLKGRVISIWITQRGIKYEVRYFDKSKAEECYFYPDELEKI